MPLPPVEPLPAAPLLDRASLEAALFGEGDGDPQVPAARRLPQGAPALDPGDPPRRRHRVLVALGVLLLVVVVAGAAYLFFVRDDDSSARRVDRRDTSVTAQARSSRATAPT